MKKNLSLDYECLYDQQGTDEHGKGYKFNEVRAGKLMYLDGFPTWDTTTAREASALVKQKPEVVEKHNHKVSMRKFTRLCHANFETKKDYHIVLTYDKKKFTTRTEIVDLGEQKAETEVWGLTYEKALKDIATYIRRLRAARRKANLDELKYIYVVEWAEDSDGTSPSEDSPLLISHLHFHVYTNGGLDRNLMEDLWTEKTQFAGWARADRLQSFGGEEFTGLTIYTMKKPRGAKKWVGSKNLKKPDTKPSRYRMGRKKAQSLAADHEQLRAWIMARFPQYDFIDLYTNTSQFCSGMYIYARLRKRD